MHEGRTEESGNYHVPHSTGQSLAVTGFYNFAVGFLDSAAFMSPAGLSVAIKICRKKKKKRDMLKIYNKLLPGDSYSQV